MKPKANIPYFHLALVALVFIASSVGITQMIKHHTPTHQLPNEFNPCIGAR